MDAKALLLTTAFRHRINEPNIETGFATFAALTRDAAGIDATKHPCASGVPGSSTARGSESDAADPLDYVPDPSFPRHGPARPGHLKPHDLGADAAAQPGDVETVTFDEFCDAVAACLRDGLIREPIRLPEGALQCHWHLELTPKGVAEAREIARRGSASEQSVPNE